VRHAREEDLDRIEPLLAQLRAIDGLTEKSRGVFYRRSKACLHFHADGDDTYADVRLDTDDFERTRATTKAEQRALVAAVKRALG
jgi:N-acetylglutamate synthase-like GNAT family acetyltransferase